MVHYERSESLKWYLIATMSAKLLETLSRLPRLEHVSINWARFPECDSSKFAKLTCADNMRFVNCPNLKFMKIFELSGSQVTIAKLEEVIPKLSWLQTYFSENEVEKIETVISSGVNLERFIVFQGDEDNIVSTICSSLKNLTSLSARASLDDWRNVKMLTRLRSLEIHLTESDLTAEQLRDLFQPFGHRLKKLIVRRSSFRQLFPSHVAAIVESCPHLEVFDLGIAIRSALDIQCLPVIANLSHLKNLTIRVVFIENKFRAFLKSVPSLKYLKSSCDKRDSEAFNQIRRDFPAIIFHVDGAYKDPRWNFIKHRPL